jgi:DNA-binding Lrp family transcriptional regulator
MKKAYVLINCDLGTENDVLTEIRSIKHVKEAHGTWGAYDIVAEVNSDTAELLRETITWNIRRLPSIRTHLLWE